MSIVNIVSRMLDVKMFLDSNMLNTTYIEVLKHLGMETISDNYKKHRKALVKNNLPHVTFSSKFKAQCEVLCTDETVHSAIKSYKSDSSREDILNTLTKCAHLARKELLSHHGMWNFSGSFTDYHTPPLT